MSRHARCDCCKKETPDPRAFTFVVRIPSSNGERATTHLTGDLCESCESVLAEALRTKTQANGRKAIKGVLGLAEAVG